MKFRSILALGLLTLALSACGARQTPEAAPTFETHSFQFYSEGSFQAMLPSWEEINLDDQNVLTMLVKDGQHIGISRFTGPPVLIINQFLDQIENDPNAYLVEQGELAGKAFFEYTTREDQQTMRNQAVLIYCQGETYALVAGGKDTVANADLFTEVLSSASCEDEFQVPDLESGKIGMMVNTAGDDYLEGFYPALRLAKENGVQILHSYILWGDVEKAPGKYTWNWNDVLMDYRFQEGFEVSLVVNLIHTTLRGSMPEDLKDKAFDDPEFIQRFTDFIFAVLERYPVDYLGLGNEVNDYFNQHRDEIPAYQTFFLAVKENIHQIYPELPVGMTFAYHDALSSGTLDIIEELDLGDFLPVTLYIYSPGFLFDREPAELENYLEGILDLAGDKQVAIVELGWNTAESLSGNQEDQAEFVREAFRLLDLHQDRIAFISWFDLYDGKLENAQQAALSFLPKDSALIEDQEFMAVFVDFLNYLGLRESDGTPKQAWFVFQEEARSYLENR